ncbi:MAG: glycosyltransferase family 1 protein [Clostridia bacterium]
MIRVLHVVTIMNRNGLENRIMDIYRNIDRSQIQFDFLTHRKEKGQFDEEIKKLGGHIYRMSPLTPKNFIKYMKNLHKFFCEHREYKIVHSHINTFSTWVLFVAKTAGIPVRIAHSRTWGMEKSWKSIFKWVSKIFINIPTTHKFACSKQAGIWLFGRKGIERPNFFHVIPNSIIIEKFQYSKEKREIIRNQLGLKENQYAFVNVGRLTPQKNHKFLLEVFKEILKTNPSSKLYLIGEGDLKHKIDQQIEKYNMKDAVIYIGNISNVGDYLNAMDGFIFPSIFEGFGTVTIEAQCSGLPIVASDSIPKETKITNLQEFISLKESPTIWAQKITEKIKGNRRMDFSNEVKKAGYDIKDTYKYLQEFYLNVSKNNTMKKHEIKMKGNKNENKI